MVIRNIFERISLIGPISSSTIIIIIITISQRPCFQKTFCQCNTASNSLDGIDPLVGGSFSSPTITFMILTAIVLEWLDANVSTFRMEESVNRFVVHYQADAHSGAHCDVCGTRDLFSFFSPGNPIFGKSRSIHVRFEGMWTISTSFQEGRHNVNATPCLFRTRCQNTAIVFGLIQTDRSEASDAEGSILLRWLVRHQEIGHLIQRMLRGLQL
mmetsp:Transcript_10693/g.19533  ORF Transcript_10693/g.19533 Transcript_10693/m.19533 type:complete len:213 (+) Transcript_10693:1734-2372(+)